MAETGPNYDRDVNNIVDELKDQRKLLTAMEVNLGVMIEQQKQQMQFNKDSQAFTRELTEFRATMDRRLSDIEKRDTADDKNQSARREEARFRITIIAVLGGGGILQVVLSHFWK